MYALLSSRMIWLEWRVQEEEYKTSLEIYLKDSREPSKFLEQIFFLLGGPQEKTKWSSQECGKEDS